MRNAGLEEAQAGVKIAVNNINNLRYANDTTLLPEREDKLKGLLVSVREKSKNTSLKPSIKETKIMASDPFISWQIDGEKVETITDFICLGSKITVDDDCSHEIKKKKYFLFERNLMTNLGSVLKSRDISLLTKVCLVKAMVFPVVRYGCESWTIKKSQSWKIDNTFELWCWRGLLRVPWIARRSNQ